MITTFRLAAALFLFAAGLRLSAFFSGSETGFYRVSSLRVGLDAGAGDSTAVRLLWYLRHPGRFVATTLVGNNVANYVTTAAIGLAAATLVPGRAGTGEIVATLAISPLVFILGELLPKTIYYRSPQQLLSRGSSWFNVFYCLFLPLSYPLMLMTRAVERLGGARGRDLELVLGRKRLVQVLTEGHREGLLSGVQNRLVEGLFEIASAPVTGSMTPSGRILGVPDTSPRDELLKHARRYGLPLIPVCRADQPDDWRGYIRVVDLVTREGPLASMIREMPRLPEHAGKLEVLLTLRSAEASLAAIVNNDKVVGLVSERGLVEQLFQPDTRAASTPIARDRTQKSG